MRDKLNDALSRENLHTQRSRMWGWVRWSPTRFVIVVGFTVITVVYVAACGLGGGGGGGQVTAGTDTEPAAETSAPSPQTTRTPSPMLPAPTLTTEPTPDAGTGGTDVMFEDAHDHDDEALGQAELVLRSFLTAYLKGRDVDSESDFKVWLDALRPSTHPLLMAGLDNTIPSNVPTGPAGEIEWQVVGGTYVEAVVALPGDVLVQVKVSNLGEGWRVVDVLPVNG